MSKPDLSEFINLSQNSKRKPCVVAQALATLSDVDCEGLKQAVDASDIITAGAIVEWLKRRELRANVSAVTSHRRGTCTCDA